MIIFGRKLTNKLEALGSFGSEVGNLCKDTLRRWGDGVLEHFAKTIADPKAADHAQRVVVEALSGLKFDGPFQVSFRNAVLVFHLIDVVPAQMIPKLCLVGTQLSECGKNLMLTSLCRNGLYQI